MASSKLVEFKTYDGLTLRGDFHSAGENKPCIIMSNGFSGRRTHYLPDFAARFHAAGYGVLVYDNRCCGESDGMPRSEVDPQMQIRDYFDAFTFASILPDVDATKIVYWGTSMSGGVALCAASINKGIKAVIVQVPFVSGEWISLTAGGDPVALLMERSKRANTGEPTMIPIFPETAEEVIKGTTKAVLKDKGAPEFAAELTSRGLEYETMTTLQSLTYSSMLEPLSIMHRIAPTPLLIIAAAEDVTTPIHLQLTAYEKALEPKKLHIFQGVGHFELYTGENFKKNMDIQMEFLGGIFAE
ncbi:Alpha/beta-hydrolase [Pleurostoma richardsiae]|uniref:Alpha/beta-hydrolase n=1 Tax=Pleurostoma richardsiae TaxID=41990 RepID=A0AA38REG9_9PEZI|nr:Alpha/beta-hydrolase [Pleurostoma richardsiae]